MGLRSTPYRVFKTAFLSFLLSLVLHIGTRFTVECTGDPYFLPTPTNVTVYEGDLAVLKCHIANLGPKMVNVVVWRRMAEDHPLTIGETSFLQTETDDMSVDHSRLSRDSSTWDLLIKNVKSRHAGVYECQVSANHLIAQYVTLHVIENSKIVPDLTITGNNFVNKGSTLHLICNATGTVRAPDAVDWFQDGSRLYEANDRWRGRIEILRHESFEGKYYVSELIIDHTIREDSGDYVCRSSDLAVKSIKVHILNADHTRKEKHAPNQSMKTEPESAGSMTIAHILPVLTISIVALVCR